MTSRVVSGIDLVEIERLSTVNPAIRRRFIDRVYTPAEQAECAGIDERLAGKFAAKEAVSKALGTGIGRVSWQDIVITKEPSGKPTVTLYRLAAQVSEALRLTDWSVSITHTRKLAAAVAMAVSLE